MNTTNPHKKALTQIHSLCGETQLKENLAMISVRFEWTKEQCDEWLKRELEKDSHRKQRNN